MTIGMEAVGILAVSGAGLTKAAVPAITAFANQTSIALKNAQAVAALRESEKRYRLVSELTTDYIFSISAEPDGQMVVEWISEGFTRMTGYTIDQIKRPNMWSNVVHPDDLPALYQFFQGILSGQSGKHTLRFITKQGELQWLNVSAQPEWDKQKQHVVGIFGAAKDITEGKEMQERLVRSEKLATLGQLAKGVSHELRNPLAAIRNAVYFLNMVVESSDSEVLEVLEILEREIELSERIISSLLNFSRIKPPVRFEINLNELVRQALSRADIPNNVEIVSQFDPALPTTLVDRTQLIQVFDHLIRNAIQAMPEGGQLKICTGQEEITNGQAAEGAIVDIQPAVVVLISDTGVGIAEEKLGKIFDPLFTTKAKGIGLGLTIVKTLVEGNGGTITVESEVGKCSAFTIRLPLDGNDKRK